jgi:hypothetical protein
MKSFEKSLMDIFREGIRARAKCDAVDANPYPEAGLHRETWFEGWLIQDVLQAPSVTDADIIDSFARGHFH